MLLGGVLTLIAAVFTRCWALLATLLTVLAVRLALMSRPN